MKQLSGRQVIFLLIKCIYWIGIYSVFIAHSIAQDTTHMTLPQCVQYSLQNRQLIKQSVIDQDIRNKDIRIALSAWLPQVRTEYTLNHYFLLPISLIPNLLDLSAPRIPLALGVTNNSGVLFQADQVLFNNDVLLAAKAGRYSRQESSLKTESNVINVVVEVSKAYYGLLLAQQQLIVSEEDIVRRHKLLTDTYNQYLSGIVDKVDYKRSSISYNNSLSARKRYTEELNYRGYLLKQLMGYPINAPLVLDYDTASMHREAYLDTNQTININRRVEYKIQNTQLQLLHLNVKYYKWDYLPKVTGFVNYNFYYQNNQFGLLYSRNFPNSQVGFKTVVPLFQGTRRVQNVQKAKLQFERLQLDQDYFKEQIQTEYALALGSYKSNFFEMKMQRENLVNAREVYQLVKYQFDQGIKTYLDVTVAEVELRTTEIAYLNSLFNVLASKLDVEKALGVVTW